MRARELFGSEDTLSQGYNICKEKCTLTFSLAVATLYKDIGIDHTCSLQTMGHQLSLTSGHASPIEEYLLGAKAHLAPTQQPIPLVTKQTQNMKIKANKKLRRQIQKMYKTSNICYILARFDVKNRDQSKSSYSQPDYFSCFKRKCIQRLLSCACLPILITLSALYPQHLSILCFFWRHISISSEQKRGNIKKYASLHLPISLQMP